MVYCSTCSTSQTGCSLFTVARSTLVSWSDKMFSRLKKVCSVGFLSRPNVGCECSRKNWQLLFWSRESRFPFIVKRSHFLLLCFFHKRYIEKSNCNCSITIIFSTAMLHFNYYNPFIYYKIQLLNIYYCKVFSQLHRKSHLRSLWYLTFIFILCPPQREVIFLNTFSVLNAATSQQVLPQNSTFTLQKT